MTRMGPLETLARMDLDALLEEIGAHYRAGALEAASAMDPEWRTAMDRAEGEVGALYQTLREADRALEDWRHAVARLTRVWQRLESVAPPAGAEVEGLDAEAGAPDLELQEVA